MNCLVLIILLCSMQVSHFSVYSTTEEAWEAMYQAICAATASIYWEMYIFIDDEAGKRFFDLLEEKARAGLDVKVIVDGFGSFRLSRNRIESLKKSGVDIRVFYERRRRRTSWWSMFISRTHRKIAIIDESVGFIGGVNIDRRMKDWLDMHVRIEGPAVRSLLRSFAKSYVISGGDKERVRRLLQYKTRIKKDVIDFIYDDAHTKESRMGKTYVEALLKARERVILFSPYYFPDKQFLRALWEARRRGIHVDILIPFRTDVRLATYAAYTWFSIMAKAGVHVHLTNKMMHGKGAVVDDNWAVVGSSNLDSTSFYDNYEANIEMKDKAMVRNVKQVLLRWIKKSQRLDLARWEKRSWLFRIKEKIAYILYRIWHRRIK